jgi:hypothetical protein
VKNNYRDFFAATKQNHVKKLTWFFCLGLKTKKKWQKLLASDGR